MSTGHHHSWYDPVHGEGSWAGYRTLEFLIVPFKLRKVSCITSNYS